MILVDASVWVAAFFPEDAHHDPSIDWLDQQLAADETLAVPILGMAEVAGALSRRTGIPALGHRANAYVVNTPNLRLVSLDWELGGIVARVAADLQLRGADAVYVAAAYVLEIPLVTWDQELVVRARSLVDVRTPASS